MERPLAAALAAAAGDGEVLARLDFLGRAVAFAHWEKRLYDAWKAKAPGRDALRRDYFSFVKEMSESDPVAVCPKWILSTSYRAQYL